MCKTIFSFAYKFAAAPDPALHLGSFFIATLDFTSFQVGKIPQISSFW